MPQHIKALECALECFTNSPGTTIKWQTVNVGEKYLLYVLGNVSEFMWGTKSLTFDTGISSYIWFFFWYLRMLRCNAYQDWLDYNMQLSFLDYCVLRFHNDSFWEAIISHSAILVNHNNKIYPMYGHIKISNDLLGRFN